KEREVEEKLFPAQWKRSRSWEDIDDGIRGLLSRLNSSNIDAISLQLFEHNLIRGRGLFCNYCIQYQLTSPHCTQDLASVVAQVNAKFPLVGDLFIRRIIHQLIIAYDGKDKHLLTTTVKFIAHLTSQLVAHETIGLQIMHLLIKDLSASDEVQTAVELVEECGGLLKHFSPYCFDSMSERFREILKKGQVDERTQASIVNVFGVERGKGKLEGYPELEQEAQARPTLSHQYSIQDDPEQEAELDVFKPDPQFLENQRAYEKLKAESSDSYDTSEVEANRRHTLYSTIMTTIHYDQGAHELLNSVIEPGREMELCIMLLDYFSRDKIYILYYARLGQRLCLLNKAYQENFDKCPLQRYSIAHTPEKNRVWNDARFFARLLATDALPWHCLAYIRLTQ
ncbi:hypothetical protein KI387_003802, partial [Taxus chinensis]